CVSDTATPQSRSVMFGCGEWARKYAICALELEDTGVEPTGVFQMLVEGNGRGKPPDGSARLEPWPRSAARSVQVVPAVRPSVTPERTTRYDAAPVTGFQDSLTCELSRPVATTALVPASERFLLFGFAPFAAFAIAGTAAMAARTMIETSRKTFRTTRMSSERVRAFAIPRANVPRRGWLERTGVGGAAPYTGSRPCAGSADCSRRAAARRIATCSGV